MKSTGETMSGKRKKLIEPLKVGRKTLTGDHATAGRKIQKYKEDVLETLLAIDPASRSIGYAYYEDGELYDSGSFEAKGDINKRLADIQEFLYTKFAPEVLAIEFIGTSTGHKYLSWSCGAIAAAFPDARLFEIKTNLWSKWRGKDYLKTDEADAIGIGKCVIEIAKEG